MSACNVLVEHEEQPAARVTPNPYRLTVREKTVAAWLGRGLDRNAIATKLSVDRAVVSGHITRIAAKLGARNAAHLNLIINTLPGLPVAQPTVFAIEDFGLAFGAGWSATAPGSEIVFSD